MNLILVIVLTAFVIFAAVMSMRHGGKDRGKSYDQRRDDTYAHYEQRMEEFRQTEMKGGSSGDE